ncbi:MAG: hypothetical protein REH79_01575 [Spiroplasma sp.]|nr:hypothetical protein [Spiroplasma sp.]
MRIGFLIAGITALILIPLIVFLYIRKLKNDRHNLNNFKVKQKSFIKEISQFWGHTIYIFIIFSLTIMALVFIPIGIN